MGGYVVNETFPITFICTATGLPPPLIQWFRGGLLLDPVMNTTFNPRFQLGDGKISMTPGDVSMVTRTLTINNAMDGDSYMYTCQATNTAVNGIDQEEFELLVQGTSTIDDID